MGESLSPPTKVEAVRKRPGWTSIPLFIFNYSKRRQLTLSSLTVIENKTLTCDRYGTRNSYRKSGTVVTAGVATKIT